jgi:hypothetical protein
VFAVVSAGFQDFELGGDVRMKQASNAHFEVDCRGCIYTCLCVWACGRTETALEKYSHVDEEEKQGTDGSPREWREDSAAAKRAWWVTMQE